MLMQTPLSPSKTNPCGTAFEIRTAFRNRRTYLLEWPLSARRRRYRIGCRRSRGGLSRRLSHQPNPSSLSQLPKPVPVPLSLTPLQLLSTSPNPLNSSDPNSRHNRLSSRHCQSVEHVSPDSDKLASLTV